MAVTRGFPRTATPLQPPSFVSSGSTPTSATGSGAAQDLANVDCNALHDSDAALIDDRDRDGH